jgi:1,2-diacylglycerol 3-alpha-glucosyltransferase
VPPAVAAFTDTYHPTVNGITYTLDTWRDRWHDRDGRMAVVFPRSKHAPRADEHPVTSLPFPFYPGFRVGLPRLPHLDDPDAPTPAVVHAHTPMGVGIAGLRYARRHDLPVVATYHTPLPEYADYLPFSRAAGAIARPYESWFYDKVDLVTGPSESALAGIADHTDADTAVISNGIDLERFAPLGRDTARDRLRDRGYTIPEGPVVGYTGRHGHEKRIGDLIDAASGLDVTVLVGGDGPAHDALRERAATADASVRFLGFLDRDALPAFYAALDVFVFPSPVETEGLVALEAMACGTPVVGVDAGALVDTVDDGETGRRVPPGDVDAIRGAIEAILADRARFADGCLDRRDDWGVDRTIDRLIEVYDRVLDS